MNLTYLWCRRRAVLVGSTNPVKLNATKQAFAQCFPDKVFEFETCEVESGVSDQPMSDEEARQGNVMYLFY